MENKKYVIGADIGGTTVKLGLFEEDGTLLEKWEIPTVIEGDGTAVLRDIAAEIQKCREKHNIPADGILGVGAGIPGPVTADGVVHRCVNLGWGVFDVRTALEETVGLPVVVVNDANAAAMGEAWKGGGRGSENVVFITLGTGVGGAVISDGRMVAGANGAAGEFGHMTINPAETEMCACGRRGCVQQYVSASGIARLARKYLAEHEEESALRSVEKLTTKDVFDAAKNGDSAANAILENVYDAFGYAISAVCTVADPEVVRHRRRCLESRRDARRRCEERLLEIRILPEHRRSVQLGRARQRRRYLRLLQAAFGQPCVIRTERIGRNG